MAIVNGGVSYDPIFPIPEGEVDGYAIKHLPVRDYYATCSPRTMIFGGHSGPTIRNPEARYHQLTHEGSVWTTDLPIEQWQQDRDTFDFSGDILIGGLGLGTIAVSLARNDRIDNVTIVELQPAVIELVEEHFPEDVAHKIEVIKGDLFNYLKSPDVEFDFAYFDIWQATSEHVLHAQVLPLRKLAREYGLRDRTVRCWAEDVMRSQIAHSLHSVLARININTDSVPEVASVLKVMVGRGLLDTMLKVERTDVYWGWALPLFEAVRDGRLDPNSSAAQFYASRMAWTYGLSAWDGVMDELARLR